MKLLIFFPILLCCLVPSKTHASISKKASLVCQSFVTGEIDALKTLEALDINIEDYSIGVNNTAKIFCD